MRMEVVYRKLILGRQESNTSNIVEGPDLTRTEIEKAFASSKTWNSTDEIRQTPDFVDRSF